MSNAQSVLLFGPPAAGKQALLGAYADSNELAVNRSVSARGSENYPHLLKTVRNERIGIELLTLPGGVWSMDAWWPLLAASRGIGLVLDGQEAREKADVEHIEALARMTLPAIRCVIFTKQDLIARGAVGVSSSLSRDERLMGWKSFRTRSDNPATQVEALNWLVEQVRGLR